MLRLAVVMEVEFTDPVLPKPDVINRSQSP